MDENNNNRYDYLDVYFDDIIIESKNPMHIINKLTDVYKFKLKGTGTLSYHLGMDFSSDEDGTMCIFSKTYVKNLSLINRCYVN